MSSSRYKRPPNCSLFVKGLNLSSNSDDLRDLFTQYGPVRDVYLPLDYHTREPRGFAYVEFEDLRDAEDALHNLDGTCLHGRELVVQYAEGDRKTPFQMKNKERTGSYNRRRYSRSPSPYYGRRSHSPYSRRRRRGSPRGRRRRSRSRSYSRSPSRSRSPPPRRRRSQSRSRSPYSRSPVRSRSRSYSRSPGGRGRSYSRSPSRSPRSKSPKQ